MNLANTKYSIASCLLKMKTVNHLWRRKTFASHSQFVIVMSQLLTRYWPLVSTQLFWSLLVTCSKMCLLLIVTCYKLLLIIRSGIHLLLVADSACLFASKFPEINWNSLVTCSKNFSLLASKFSSYSLWIYNATSCKINFLQRIWSLV